MEECGARPPGRAGTALSGSAPSPLCTLCSLWGVINLSPQVLAAAGVASWRACLLSGRAIGRPHRLDDRRDYARER